MSIFYNIINPLAGSQNHLLTIWPLLSVMTPHASEQGTADGSSSSAFACVTGNAADDSPLGGTGQQVFASGCLWARPSCHIAEESAACSSSSSPFSRVTGDAADDSPFGSTTQGVVQYRFISSNRLGYKKNQHKGHNETGSHIKYKIVFH
jgi:hypothetical protein